MPIAVYMYIYIYIDWQRTKRGGGKTSPTSNEVSHAGCGLSLACEKRKRPPPGPFSNTYVLATFVESSCFAATSSRARCFFICGSGLITSQGRCFFIGGSPKVAFETVDSASLEM